MSTTGQPHRQTTDDAFDQWLVLRAQGGDQDALRRLVDRWKDRLHRHALRLTGRADVAGDVSQEAWLAIVRNLGGLHDPAAFRGWAYQIVGRRCADWIRRQQRQRATSRPLASDPAADAATDPEPGDEIGALRKALRELDAADRSILAMHHLDGLPLREIATALDLPIGTVKSRLFHARQRLKRLLDGDR